MALGLFALLAVLLHLSFGVFLLCLALHCLLGLSHQALSIKQGLMYE